MSVSQHPIALRLEETVGGATRLLATVMALPLIDGIFAALVLAGALSTPVGILETGLLIFGGSATMAVILAEMEGTRRQQMASVLLIGALIIPVAAVQAAIAPTLASLLNLDIFQRFAGLVILAIAAKTASSKVGEILPSPGVIIAFGLVASFEPSGAALEFTSDPMVVARGAAAAAVGVAFALGVAIASPQLRGRVNIDRFRFGSAVALGVLALPILGLLQTDAPIALAVLTVTALFAYDPDADPEAVAAYARGDSDDDSPDTQLDVDAVDDEGPDDEDSVVDRVTDVATGAASNTDGYPAAEDRAGPLAPDAVPASVGVADGSGARTSQLDGVPAAELGDRSATSSDVASDTVVDVETDVDEAGGVVDGAGEDADDEDERAPWL
ncbi:DUF5794 domain-containing protein [Haloparvum sp. PAK95]|uniref:DUF5794 domain-containing protein n=1 Tax=Haloparvum sp. PAK95 TaxID=3418962 RepID=UPI003D2EADFC